MILFIILLPLLTTANTQLYSQRATLFSSWSSKGSFTTLVESYYPDLRTLTFDNLAQSTCVTGIWLFYDHKYFNPTNGVMEYVFGPSNFCVDFQNLPGRVSSARFAGSSRDYRLDSLTLYTGTYFQGEEEFTPIDLLTLHLDRLSSSLIITGGSPWTLYDDQYFKGNAICVSPPSSTNFSPALIYDTKTVGAPHRSIRSLRRGCFAANKIYAQLLSSEGLVSLQTGNESHVTV